MGSVGDCECVPKPQVDCQANPRAEIDGDRERFEAESFSNLREQSAGCLENERQAESLAIAALSTGGWAGNCTRFGEGTKSEWPELIEHWQATVEHANWSADYARRSAR